MWANFGNFNRAKRVSGPLLFPSLLTIMAFLFVSSYAYCQIDPSSDFALFMIDIVFQFVLRESGKHYPPGS